jgi:hypothetical protein
MDATRFDRLARVLSTTPPRRGILTALAKVAAGTTFAALLGVPAREEAVAACLAHRRGVSKHPRLLPP